MREDEDTKGGGGVVFIPRPSDPQHEVKVDGQGPMRRTTNIRERKVLSNGKPTESRGSMGCHQLICGVEGEQ